MVKKKPAEPRRELIIWKDAASGNTEWVSRDKCDVSAFVAETEGVNIYEDDKQIVLAQTVERDGKDLCCTFQIPKGTIIGRYELLIGRKIKV